MSKQKGWRRRGESPAERVGGFTLVELLTVIAIITLLITLFFPAVQASRDAARRTQCANNLKQLGLGFLGYHDAKQALPPSRLRDSFATWAVFILPYIEQTSTYEQWDVTDSYYNQPESARQAQVPAYLCPTRRSPPQLSRNQGEQPPGVANAYGDSVNSSFSGTHFPGALADYASCTVGTFIDPETGRPKNPSYNQNANGAIIGAESKLKAERIVSWRSMTTLADILDGASNTLMVGEKHVRPGYFGWIQTDGAGILYGDGSVLNGNQSQCSARRAGPGTPIAATMEKGMMNSFGSWHPGVCQFVLCDGSVKSLAVSTSEDFLRRLMIRNDGEGVGAF
jgi:prepilin-type N-terminal cleavage/methylation domain-containing protein